MMEFSNYELDPREDVERLLQKLHAISLTRKFSTVEQHLLDEAMASAKFHEFGRPYCKVYPRMADVLADVDLTQIKTADFSMPFPAFEICLPRPKWKSSILFSIVETNKHRRLILCVDPPATDGIAVLSADLLQNDNFGEIIRSGTINDVTEVGEATEIGPLDLFGKQCLSIAISTALFMVDNHRLVCPDLEPRQIRAKHVNSRKKGKLVPRAASLTLGREMELPPPVHEDTERNEGEGRELQYSHARRGHLRHQRCGPGRKDRKLIFIMPLIVRPDLPPPAARAGHFIPDQS